MSRRWTALVLAATVPLSSSCVSARGASGGAWMAGMMGVMMIGGLVLGSGMMHGIMRPPPDTTAVDSLRFSPTRLLEQRELLELDDQQVGALQSLRDDVAGGTRPAAEAARAAYRLLRPVQRAAVSHRRPMHDRDHSYH